jgi:hypothetical protein
MLLRTVYAATRTEQTGDADQKRCTPGAHKIFAERYR